MATPVQIAFENLQTAQQNLLAKQQRLSNLQAVLDADPQKWSTTLLNFDGGQHQRIVLQTLAVTLAGEISALQTAIPNLQKNYDNALSAEQKAAANAAYLANPRAAVDIKLAQLKAEGELAAKKLMQGTTKYLIWGSVAMVVIIAAILIYKRKFSA